MKSPIAWLPNDYNEVDALQYKRPFHTFLIKIASLCNLNCDYCYVYQTPDKSWQWKPKHLEVGIANQIAQRIQDHVAEHELKELTIVFHGGEPLLVGIDRLKELTEIFDSIIQSKILWGMQTNGTLVDEETIQFFFENNFRFGLSLDGRREHNDRHRLYHSGKSSYDDTVKAIHLIKSFPEWQRIFGGLLIVIDIKNRPVDILETMNELGVHSANILLPDSHHESLPPGKTNPDDLIYGKWLFELFDIWYHNYQHIEIPYFEEIITLMLGGISGAEEIGAKSVDLIVIDTNGDIEAVDTLKVVGRSATSLNMNVTTHTFNDALEHPAIYSRMSGFNSLCKQCRECEYLDNCGGGYVPHRYSHQKGFLNPSVYCNDLKYLFSKMKSKIFKDQSIYTFSKIEDVNNNWLTEKEYLLDDLFVLIEQLNNKSGKKLKQCIDVLKSLKANEKNKIIKDIVFLNWFSELNDAILKIYENPGEEWSDSILNDGVSIILSAVNNLKEKGFAFLSLPQFEGIGIVSNRNEVFLDEVADLVDVQFDFEIDETQWLSDLTKALELIKLDESSYTLVKTFVSYIVPLKRNVELRNMSFSTRNLPNVIFKNNEGIAYLFGETLVHEADHQFFYLLENIDSFWQTDVKQQKAIYCSPWRDDKRPLDGILRGLSAFTRVCNYYSNVIVNVKDQKEENKVGELLLTKLVQCEDATNTILESNQLSDFGDKYVSEMKTLLIQIDNSIKNLQNYSLWRNEAMQGINTHRENWMKQFQTHNQLTNSTT